LACTTPQQALGPLSGAAKYPAGARPSKCIIIIIFPKPPTAKERNPNYVRVMIRMKNDRNVVPFIFHGKVHEFAFDITKPSNVFRNQLKRKFKLKGLVWSLERRNVHAGVESRGGTDGKQRV
jgi:hypothetical protein